MRSPVPDLSSFAPGSSAVLFGARSGIGAALADQLEMAPTFQRVYRVSRQSARGPREVQADLLDEGSLAELAKKIKQEVGEIDLVILATGILHADDLQPEKSIRHMDLETMERVFRVNAFGPTLAAKHLLPLLRREGKAVFSALSARVGSISDNRLGGWYSYRASKAALNMMIKSMAIEVARRRPETICVGLHPGTVDTDLSQPFQANLPEGRLFRPEESAGHLLRVIEGLKPQDSGGCFAWDGAAIPA